MDLVAASEFDGPTLTRLFNAGFSGYLVPMRLNEEAFEEHVALYDIDLDLSRVVVTDGPVAFALVGRRGRLGWIGGMGTAPAHRRRGLGEKALAAAIEASAVYGCGAVGLEVLDNNQPAIRLYRKLGFEIVRDLAVWSLAPTGDRPDPAIESVDVGRAQEWIAAHRTAPEPWQRADATLAALEVRGAQLRGLIGERDGKIAAAAIIREQPETVAVLQVAAADERAASSILQAAAGNSRTLWLSNIPVRDHASRGIELLGANRVVNQYEMSLQLS